jgi:hypothetical protein
VSNDLVGVRAINDGQWHHVLAVYDSAIGHKIYIDGVVDKSDSNILTAVAQSASADNANIGRRADGNTFNGLIDDVRIYNRALSPDEIKRLYTMGR